MMLVPSGNLKYGRLEKLLLSDALGPWLSTETPRSSVLSGPPSL